MATALAAGDYPSGDTQAWIDRIVRERRDTPVEEMLAAWDASADGVSTLVDGGAGLLFADLVVHEHDLRAALGQPGSRGTAEVRAVVQPLLDVLAPAIKEAGLGALLVDSGPVTWTSHFGKPGCTLHLDPWEATRALSSRRTHDELLAVPHTGDLEPYVKVIDGHLPLPTQSLHE